MKKFVVTGMTCAACQARVEKAVQKVAGVKSVSVSLLTNSMGVTGTASDAAVIQAVTDAGYGAFSQETDTKQKNDLSAKLAAQEEALQDKETPKLLRRLIASGIFLLLLMYVSMGHMMLGWRVPLFLQDNTVAVGLFELLLSAIVMVINQRFFISGYKSLFHRAPNMDTLIALGSSAAFVYSTIVLFVRMQGGAAGDYYFESAAMIVTLITVGKLLESYTKGKTTNALKSLLRLAPKTACVIKDGAETIIPVDEVRMGDVFVVRPGEQIPVDGIVTEGSSAVNEAALTGESIPVDKEAGDEVSSGTMNQSGFLTCQATRVGEDTTLAQIIQMVSDAAATKAPVARLADRISSVFVPIVLAIAVVTAILWLLLGREVGFSLARGISVLVVSCPCALGLATPVAIIVGNGMGAKHGILFKTAESMQEAGNVQIVCLDKTGTITEGNPKVTNVLAFDGCSETELLQAAVSLEQKSEHPLAKAILAYAEEKHITADAAEDFEALSGNGLKGSTAKGALLGGSEAFMKTQAAMTDEVHQQFLQLAKEGKTPLFFAKDRRLLGMIAVSDTIKKDSKEAILQLHKQGLYVVMLTGDNEQTAQAIAQEVGVDEVAAGVKPNEKAAVVERLQTFGKVAMVGDGINDAPALTKADIGIAIGAGADVAIDAADIVLMKSSLLDVAAAIRLSRRTYLTILENLFWALFYNVLLIPAAAGVYVALGITMNPMLGAAAMSISSFCVVMNALRLNLAKIHDASRDKKRKNSLQSAGNKLVSDTKENEHITEETKRGKTMEKTLKIEGMMCGHCEMRVKKVLEALAEVDSAVVSHEAGTAIVTLNREVADDVLKQAVEAQDYPVLEII